MKIEMSSAGCLLLRKEHSTPNKLSLSCWGNNSEFHRHNSDSSTSYSWLRKKIVPLCMYGFLLHNL